MPNRAIASRCLGTLLALFGAVLLTLPLGVSAGIAPVLNPANGHYYLAAAAPEGGISWPDARAAAAAMRFGAARGYLATVTSAAENAFIAKNFAAAVSGEYLLGGFQAAGSEEPAGGWRWVTDEPWAYTNWIPGEPNNIDGGEEVLQMKGGGRWNDTREAGPFAGYFVEFDSSPVNLVSLKTRPKRVKGGRSVTGTLTLDQAPKEAGLTVTLRSESSLFKGPSSVTLRPEKTTTSFKIRTRKTRGNRTVAITATFGDSSVQAALRVKR